MKPLLGLIRHALTFVGGYLVATGKLAEIDLETISAGIVTLVGVIWSIYEKKPDLLNKASKTSFLPAILLPFFIISLLSTPVGCVTAPDGSKTVSPILGGFLKETMRVSTLVGLSEASESVSELREYTPEIATKVNSIFAENEDVKLIGAKLKALFTEYGVMIGNASLADLLYSKLYNGLIDLTPNADPDTVSDYRFKMEFLSALKP